MRTYAVVFLIAGFLCGCKGPKLVTDRYGKKIPQLTWESQTIDVGEVKKGQSKLIEFKFKNTGSIPLDIELVTACKCTTLDWPRRPIPVGGEGVVTVTFDSTDQVLGTQSKTVDVIANTSPIVVEAFFTVTVVE